MSSGKGKVLQRCSSCCSISMRILLLQVLKNERELQMSVKIGDKRACQVCKNYSAVLKIKFVLHLHTI